MRKIKWEEIECHRERKQIQISLFRCKVPGGWLVLTVLPGESEDSNSSGLTFYPDANHYWDVKSLD
jgi:hypothetical protein